MWHRQLARELFNSRETSTAPEIKKLSTISLRQKTPRRNRNAGDTAVIMTLNQIAREFLKFVENLQNHEIEAKIEAISPTNGLHTLVQMTV